MLAYVCRTAALRLHAAPLTGSQSAAPGRSHAAPPDPRCDGRPVDVRWTAHRQFKPLASTGARHAGARGCAAAAVPPPAGAHEALAPLHPHPLSTRTPMKPGNVRDRAHKAHSMGLFPPKNTVYRHFQGMESAPQCSDCSQARGPASTCPKWAIYSGPEDDRSLTPRD